MERNGLLYRIALSTISGIGPVNAKRLLDRFGDAESIFRADIAALETVVGIGPVRAKAIANFNQFDFAEKELAFIEKYGIQCLFFTDQGYPQRLLGFKEAPVLLYYKGNADLNSRRIVSVVGTRNPTEYGKLMAEQLVKELAAFGPLVISGLAYGIDAIAHRVALAHNLPTIGVLGHGLDKIYPPHHRELAMKMIREGGLLTSFNRSEDLAAHNFPLRNKIVAGMCDALVVVETAVDGGSMLTIGDAVRYKKKVFAFPGRVMDKTSSGCNQLIQEGSARLLLNASQLSSEMDWIPAQMPRAQAQREVPSDKNLSDNEKKLLRLLKDRETRSIDQLSVQTELSYSAIAVSLLSLELNGLVRMLPGNMCRLAV